jgi:hypothetical protein
VDEKIAENEADLGREVRAHGVNTGLYRYIERV